MATIQINNTNAPIVISNTYYRVQVRSSWGGAWVTVNYLQPLSASISASPAKSSCKFKYQYGEIKREDSNEFLQYAPLNILDYYIRVLSIKDGVTSVVWTGIVVDNSYELYGSGTAVMGDQSMTAYGLEYLLDRKPILGAYVDGGLSIGWTPTFNYRPDWGGGFAGNRSSSPVSSNVYVFSQAGQVWTNLDILYYVLNFHAPAGVIFQLSGQFSVLSAISGTYKFEGLTLTQVIDKLVDRRRGLGWSVRVNDEVVSIHVFTNFDKTVVVDGQAFPANLDQLTIDLNAADVIEVGSATLSISHAPLYGRVIVQGQRVKSCFSVAFNDGNLQRGWSNDEESNYQAIAGTDALEKDSARSADNYDSVYKKFTIPENWDGLAANGLGGHKSPIAYDFDNDARINTNGKGAKLKTPLLRYLPLQTIDNGSASARPAVYIKAADQYSHVEHLDKIQKNASHVALLDNERGFKLQPTINHVLALNHYDLTEEETRTLPDQDYTDLIATVAIETDARPCVNVEINSALDKTLVIDVHDAEYWHVVPGTVSGVNNGALSFYSGGYERDDTHKLRSVGELAKAWYGKIRGSLSLNIKRVINGVLPGQLVTSVTSSWQQEDVNTVISSIQFDFSKKESTIVTGYGELDFTVILDIPGMSDFRSVGRAFNKQQSDIDELRRHVGNMSIRRAQANPTSTLSDSEKAAVDFIVDNFDRADADQIGVYWSNNAGFRIRGEKCIESVASQNYPDVFERIITSGMSVLSGSSAGAVINQWDGLPVGIQLDASESHTTIAAHADSANSSDRVSLSDILVPTGDNELLNANSVAAIYSESIKQSIRYSGARRATNYPSYYKSKLLFSDMHIQINIDYVITEKITQSIVNGVNYSAIYTANLLGCNAHLLCRGNLDNDTKLLASGILTSISCFLSYDFGGIVTSLAGSVSSSSSVSAVVSEPNSPGPLSLSSSSTADFSINEWLSPYGKEFISRWSSYTLSGIDLLRDPLGDINYNNSVSRNGVYDDINNVVSKASYSYLSDISGKIDISLYSTSRLTDMSTTSTDDTPNLTPNINGFIEGDNTLKVSAIGNIFSVYINNVKVNEITQVAELTGKYVGIKSMFDILTVSISDFNKLDNFIGITQFKAWVDSMPEPAGLESGHGKYFHSVGGADDNWFEYTDGYHEKQLDEDGNVILDPNGHPLYNYIPTKFDA